MHASVLLALRHLGALPGGRVATVGSTTYFSLPLLGGAGGAARCSSPSTIVVAPATTSAEQLLRLQHPQSTVQQCGAAASGHRQ